MRRTTCISGSTAASATVATPQSRGKARGCTRGRHGYQDNHHARLGYAATPSLGCARARGAAPHPRAAAAGFCRHDPRQFRPSDDRLRAHRPAPRPALRVLSRQRRVQGHPDQVRGNCSTCHNGVMAQGKGPTHIVTDLECDACHTTLTWAGAFFTHKGVTSNCASCHNGVAAQGMPPTHFPIGTPPTPCEGCHSTTNFTTWAGTLINHLAVTAVTCASCHETGNYLGMHPSTNTTAADSRPPTALDPIHPA